MRERFDLTAELVVEFIEEEVTVRVHARDDQHLQEQRRWLGHLSAAVGLGDWRRSPAGV